MKRNFKYILLIIGLLISYHAAYAQWTFTPTIKYSGNCSVDDPEAQRWIRQSENEANAMLQQIFSQYASFPNRAMCDQCRNLILSIRKSNGYCTVYYTCTQCTGRDIAMPGQGNQTNPTTGNLNFNGPSQGQPFFSPSPYVDVEYWIDGVRYIGAVHRNIDPDFYNSLKKNSNMRELDNSSTSQPYIAKSGYEPFDRAFAGMVQGNLSTPGYENGSAPVLPANGATIMPSLPVSDAGQDKGFIMPPGETADAEGTPWNYQLSSDELAGNVEDFAKTQNSIKDFWDGDFIADNALTLGEIQTEEPIFGTIGNIKQGYDLFNTGKSLADNIKEGNEGGAYADVAEGLSSFAGKGGTGIPGLKNLLTNKCEDWISNIKNFAKETVDVVSNPKATKADYNRAQKKQDDFWRREGEDTKNKARTEAIKDFFRKLL